MSNTCCGAGQPRMILACSGGSNVGQLTNQAAVELTREGRGRMFCLAGLGGGIPGLVQAARDAGPVLVLDGCAVGCAKAIAERAGLAGHDHLVVTDLGIDKVKDPQLTLRPEEVARVKDAALQGRP
ncbi:MAG: putative zinc-binding protein [Proteobacteria bacterium]|nr:putative zinc-binding protein [Pseudomonadota bacterium]MBU1596429.1 putative zinc-binding protein [Pseudomonadota bacterium]